MKARITVIALAALPLLAQQEAGKGNFSIAGYVVNSVTGARIRAASVLLEGAGFADREATLTDDSGAFRFRGLPGGPYTLTAAKRRYSDRSKPVTVKSDSHLEGVVVPLEPLALIKGRITDAYGEPVPNVLVHALQPRVTDGRRRVEMPRWAVTNDRGDYRLWDLEAGAYFVKVVGRSSGTRFYLGPGDLRPAEPDEAFAPVYYGGSQSLAGALPQTVAPGGEVEANFTLTLQPGHRISGRVSGATPYRPARIELLSGDEEAGGTGAALNVANGSFVVEDVVDGSYTLRITQGEGLDRVRGLEQFDVAGQDVGGLMVRLTPGVTVKGRVLLEGTLPAGVRAQGFVSLRPVAQRRWSHEEQYRATLDENLEFEMRHVLAGRYSIHFTPGFGYVASITFNQKDVPPSGEITIPQAESSTPLEIVVRRDGGKVEGSAVIDGHPASGLAAIVPVAMPGATVRTAPLSANGRFEFTMVPPGEYRVQVWRDGVEVAYAEPEVVRVLLGQGERLQVLPSGVSKVEVTSFTEAPRWSR